MGLDMYLERDHYIGGHHDFNNVQGDINLTTRSGPIRLTAKQVSSIIEQVGYWRKANAIHHWFVENCADGVDECQRIWVSKDKLKELYKLCKKVKENPELASELLPTQAGFFFGNTEYGEWYMDDIDATIKILKPIIRGKDTSDYYYQASW